MLVEYQSGGENENKDDLASRSDETYTSMTHESIRIGDHLMSKVAVFFCGGWAPVTPINRHSSTFFLRIASSNPFPDCNGVKKLEDKC